MSKDQAEAILFAEQVLQSAGVSPFVRKGGAWRKYVQDAVEVVAEDPLLYGQCDKLRAEEA